MGTIAIPAPHKAEKKRVKLKMAVQGPSGSGKTWGALALAKNLWPEAKICVIDTENESASLYADRFDFDTIPLGPPFGTDRYIQCIDAVVKGGYDVLIIDSITAQWDGEGGILRRKEELERRNPGVNGYTLWARFTPEHEAFKQVILQAPLHVICTMRSKQEYALQTNDKGKQVPVKLGLAPIQRDQIDYEFTLVFDLSLQHIAVVSKDRTALFNDKTVDLTDAKTADAIRDWLAKGIETVTPGPMPIVFPVMPDTSNAIENKAIEDAQREPFAILAGTRLTCTPLTVQDKTRKVGDGTQPFVKVFFKGNIQGVNETQCFDVKLFEAVHAGLNEECQFKVEVKDKDGKVYINIKDVIYVGEQYYEFGKPAQIGDVNASPFTEPA